MTSALRIIHSTIIHIMETYTSASGWDGGPAGVLPAAGAAGGGVGDAAGAQVFVVGVGEVAAGAASHTAVPGMATAVVTATTAMGITAMARATVAMATAITVMAIRMDGPADILPEHPVQADTQVGMPGQAEDLRVVNLAEPDSLADTVGLWPQQDIREDQPPPGGISLLARSQRDTPPREEALVQTARDRLEQVPMGPAKRRGLSR